jgi:uncharacterized membrane protein
MEGLREPRGHRGRTPLQSRLEHHFERWLWRFRLIAIVPVVMSLLSSAAAFLSGSKEILYALQLLRTTAGRWRSCWACWSVAWTST